MLTPWTLNIKQVDNHKDKKVFLHLHNVNLAKFWALPILPVCLMMLEVNGFFGGIWSGSKHKFLFTVFGNTGLHLILRGSVVPQTSTAFSPTSERYSTEFPSPTPVFDKDELQVTAKVWTKNFTFNFYWLYSVCVTEWNMYRVYLLWFKFFLGLKFSEPVWFYFSLFEIVVMNLTQRKIKIKLVQKNLNQKQCKPQHIHCKYIY